MGDIFIAGITSFEWTYYTIPRIIFSFTKNNNLLLLNYNCGRMFTSMILFILEKKISQGLLIYTFAIYFNTENTLRSGYVWQEGMGKGPYPFPLTFINYELN